jgi:hypothetical protein
MKNIKRIFYIYSEATMFVLFGFVGLLELLCSACLQYSGLDSFVYLTFGFGVFFLIIAMSSAYSVYKQEKANN